MDRRTQSKNMRTRDVILFPIPEAGHINPMFYVAKALHSKSISITFILTKYKSPNPSNFPPDYTFHFIDDGLDAAKASFTDPMALLAALLANCHEPFRVCIASILASRRLSGRSGVACLITDPLWQFTRSVCEELKLPRLALLTFPVADLVILCSPDVMHHKDYSSYPELIAIADEMKATSGVICNSFEELEGTSLETFRQHIPQVPIFPIGPLHKRSTTSVTSSLSQEKTQIISWLDNQTSKSVLYVSFGTLATITKAEVEEIAWGLAHSNQPFLWVVRDGLVLDKSKQSELLPKDFLEATSERGFIVTWAPQQEVLAHDSIGGALVHGGWNSTMENIAAGVPMICMPCQFPDQKTTAKNVSGVWGNGLHIQRGVSRIEVENAIRTVMIGEDGKEIRDKAAAMKDIARNCLEEGGSSYLSLDKLCNFILSL